MKEHQIGIPKLHSEYCEAPVSYIPLRCLVMIKGLIFFSFVLFSGLIHQGNFSGVIPASHQW